MSEGNGNTPARTASLRAEVLKSKIGKAYSRNPRERLENRMDRPVNGKRRSIFKEEQRIEAAIERYSWCWPICMDTAVLTLGVLGISAEEARQQGLRLGDDEGEDTFILDEHGEAKPLLATHMAGILGLQAPNVSSRYSLMVAKKTLKVDGKRVSLVPAPPQLTPEEREKVIQIDNFFATLDLPEDGPKLPREDFELLASIPEKVIRLDIFNELSVIQTDYEKARREIQTERDRRRKVIHEKARNLIVNQPSQRDQSPVVGECVDSAAKQPPTHSPSRLEDIRNLLVRLLAKRLIKEPDEAICLRTDTNLKGAPIEYLRVKIDQRMAAIESYGFVADNLAKDVGDTWAGEQAREKAAQPAPRPQAEPETRERRIRTLQDAIEDAQKIADDKTGKFAPDERQKQRDRAEQWRAELAALNGKADAVGGGS